MKNKTESKMDRGVMIAYGEKKDASESECRERSGKDGKKQEDEEGKRIDDKRNMIRAHGLKSPLGAVDYPRWPACHVVVMLSPYIDRDA